jgi:hypothetical protein
MASHPKRVQALFLAAVELPAAERAAVLDRECSDDVELRQRVEALLQAHDKPGSFLDRRARDSGATGDEQRGREEADAFEAAAPTEGPGTSIGLYKLLQQIGEGGMGVVYMAEQEQPVRRRVALKIIKPGMDSAAVIRRFEAERQALALMNHTHIAKVLDAGTAAGRPFFVMELVRACQSPSTAMSCTWRYGSGWSCSCRFARRSRTLTRRGSSTATSSPPTYWCACKTAGRCRR